MAEFNRKVCQMANMSKKEFVEIYARKWSGLAGAPVQGLLQSGMVYSGKGGWYRMRMKEGLFSGKNGWL